MLYITTNKEYTVTPNEVVKTRLFKNIAYRYIHLGYFFLTSVKWCGLHKNIYVFTNKIKIPKS